MEIVLYGDPFKYHIINELKPKELYYIRQVNKQFNKIIKYDYLNNCIINTVKSRLREIFDKETDEFLELLNKENAIICGPFITQCLLDEYWNNCNLEIYLDNYIDIYSTRYYEDPKTLGGLIAKKIGNSKYHRGKLSDPYEISLYKIQTFKANNIINKIKFTMVSSENKIQGLNELFEFDFCKNMFVKNKLIIYDLNNLLTSIYLILI